MNYTFPNTDPRHFGAYEVQKWPIWPVYLTLALTAVFLYFNPSVAVLGIIIIIFFFKKKNYIGGLVDATETPTAPTIGQANIRATYTRRVVTYRPPLLLPFVKGDTTTQLLVFIALSELAKARLRNARAWNNVLYTYKYTYKPGDESQYQYRLRDIVEKGPLIFEKADVNELNAIEDDIRAAVDNLAHYVKNLSQDEARSSTDTVEY